MCYSPRNAGEELFSGHGCCYPGLLLSCTAAVPGVRVLLTLVRSVLSCSELHGEDSESAREVVEQLTSARPLSLSLFHPFPVSVFLLRKGSMRW